MKQIVAAEEIEDVPGLQRVERRTRERAERRRGARQIRQSVGVGEAPAAVRRRVRDVEAAAARGFADALPLDGCVDAASQRDDQAHGDPPDRSEEHTSELQSQSNLVCRLLLEKKKKNLVSLVTDEQHTADILVHHMLYY